MKRVFFSKVTFSIWNLFRIHRTNKQIQKYPAEVSDPTLSVFHLHSRGKWAVDMLLYTVLMATVLTVATALCSVRLRSLVWYQEHFLSFAHVKLVERLLAAAASHRAFVYSSASKTQNGPLLGTSRFIS